MSINIDQIKKKLEVLQKSDNTSKAKWKPEPGKNYIRIVPYQHDKSNPFIELYFHFNLGKSTYLSLTTFGEKDPIAEFAEQMQQTGNKDDWKMGKRLEPTLRTFAPVIVRGKEAEGVKLWGFGKTIYQELLNTILDPDYGDITDLQNGRDVTVDYQTPKEANNTYGKISVRPKPNTSVATNDKAVAELIMKNQPKIEDVFPKPTYEELRKALEKYLHPESETESPEKTDKKPKVVNNDDLFEEKEAPAEEKGTAKSSNVVSDFEDLFKEED